MQASYCYTPALVIIDKDYQTQKRIGTIPVSFTIKRGYQKVPVIEEIPVGAVPFKRACLLYPNYKNR